MKIYVVGAGPGNVDFLTQYALNIAKKANIVVTTERLYQRLGHLNKNTFSKEILQIPDFIKEQKNISKVCILASGDVGFFSIAKMLKKAFPKTEIEFISGVSSLQFITAKLGVSYDDIKLLSGHGREIQIVPNVCYNKKVFLLTGGKKKAHDFIKELYDFGLTDVTVTIGENLSDENEQIVSDKVKNLLSLEFSNLAVMIIENNNFVNAHERICDKDFIRGKSPMTKQSIRDLSIAALNIKPMDKIVDVGAGTGSVTIAMARSASEGMITAIEKEDYALDLIKQNIEKLGAYNIKIKKSIAPQGLENELFDKAFIGGSSGNLDEIISFLLNKNHCQKIVVTAVTLETLHNAVTSFKENNLEMEIISVNIAKAEKIASYNLMKAENPVYIISGTKKNDD